ncbi:hypothetical protein P872_00530 [Rhodonellum psychrophilum GCM71 = DSM 17998]|uniref:Uncharacterized protein n=2 Tax=Rhodonellum TaxID=336827 RepID=U5C526_9BACT|nr:MULTISPECIES: hypothetical protein [Rhodonellum]ERM84026.1 hypothetical protein P872_00530 [Rhodonellum psychrophilum GCM71 = DSM 17998]MDO9552748.1 hypothetical protein [Rhodonellum sp.]SDY39833.1 hypothetical protein SAMN05444412_10128 [Rhodonellum ikkaensis]
MKLGDILLLSLSAALVIIGTHLTMKGGVTLSYPVFMLAVVLLFWYQFRKMQLKQEQDSKESRPSKKPKNKH